MSEDMNISGMLNRQIERLLARSVDPALRALAEEGQFAQALWTELDAMGVASALVPEPAGGAGFSWGDVERTFRLLGQHAAPVPLGETMVGAWALASAGLEVPAGPVALSGAKWSLDDDGLLTGADPLVPWAPQVRQVVLVAHRDGQRYVGRLDMSTLAGAAVETYERTPAGRITLTRAVAADIGPAPGFGELGLRPHLATLRAVQMAGALARILDLCVEYGNTRVQFGKPIGKFQAIQHMIAELAGHAAAAQVAGLHACRQLDSGNVDAAEFGAAVAKSRLGMAATRGAAIAHQVFGAMGVTEEHELHYFTRRLWQWRAEGGSEHEWSEHLGRAVLACGGAALWDRLANHAADSSL